MRSLKFAFRTLFRTPFVTLVAIVSLALGIGATAGIFSVFNQVLRQSLAVPEPSELVNLSAPGPKPGFGSCGRAGDCERVFSYGMFRDLQRIQTVFTDIAAHVGFGANLAYEAQTSSNEGLLVSGSYFPVLELQPAFGRLINPNDDKLVGESRVVVGVEIPIACRDRVHIGPRSPRCAVDRGLLIGSRTSIERKRQHAQR
jgi:hypothetical protein